MIDANETNLNVHSLGPTKKVPKCVIYHFGHALPEEVMKRKHNFYVKRDKGTHDKCAECWRGWKGKIGKIWDGVISKVDWNLPQIVQKAWKGMKTWNVR